MDRKLAGARKLIGDAMPFTADEWGIKSNVATASVPNRIGQHLSLFKRYNVSPFYYQAQLAAGSDAGPYAQVVRAERGLDA